MKLWFWIMITTLTTLNIHHAMAGNGMDRGGGDIYYDTKTGRPMLADPYISRSGEASAELSCNPTDRFYPTGALASELSRISYLLSSYGADSAPRVLVDPSIVHCAEGVFPAKCSFSHESEWLRSQFVKTQILNQEIVYCLVQKVPHRSALIPVENEVAGKTQAAGFTAGKYTYLQTDIFASMSVREQAKLLVHERMHALPSSPSYATIAAVTDGLEAAMNLVITQSSPMNKGLDIGLLDRLAGLHEGIKTAQLISHPELGFHIHPNGGGLVSDSAKISPNAFVGVGAIVGPTISADGGARFTMSDICASGGNRGIHFESGTRVENSSLMYCQALYEGATYAQMPFNSTVARNSQISNSAIKFALESSVFQKNFAMEEGSAIIDSRLNPQYLVLRKNSRIVKSRVIGYEISPQGQTHSGLYLELGESSELRQAYNLLVEGNVSGLTFGEVVTNIFRSSRSISEEPYLLKVKPGARIDATSISMATELDHVNLGIPLYPIASVRRTTEINSLEDLKDLVDRRYRPLVFPAGF